MVRKLTMTAYSSQIRHFWSRWDHFWTRTGPPHMLALFRIIFGGFLLFYFSIQLPHVTMLYSREGALLPMFTPDQWWSLIFTPPPPWVAQLIFSTFITSLLCLTIGAWSQGSAAIAFILYLYYRTLSLYQFGTSFDRLFITILAVLMFSGCG